MVLSGDDKILIKNLYICTRYSGTQLINYTKAGLSTACKLQDVDKLKRHLIDSWTSSRRSLIKRLISDELGWGHPFQREADILNIGCNGWVLHCLSALFATIFYLNIRDNNDGVLFKLTWRNWRWFMYPSVHLYAAFSQCVTSISFKRYWRAWCFVANLLRYTCATNY